MTAGGTFWRSTGLGRQMLSRRLVIEFELTIESSGKVSDTKVLFSDLGDKATEMELVELLQGIDFGAKKVARQVVQFPLSFMPS